MADVRLTATNPDDSTVVPVACNAKGELKLEEPPEFDGILDGDLTVTGSSTFTGPITGVYNFWASTQNITFSDGTADKVKGLKVGTTSSDSNAVIFADGSCTFAGPVKHTGYDSDYGCNLYTDEANQGGLFAKARSINGVLSYQCTAFAATWDGDDRARIRYDGRAFFKGNLDVGGSSADAKVAVAGVYDQTGLSVSAGGANYSNCAEFYNSNGTFAASIGGAGNATFSGDVVVGSRSQKWTLVENGGLCHMVAVTESRVDPSFGVDVGPDYPELRDVFKELDMVESALQQVMERLKMAPPAGWEVWDGSDT